MASVSGSRKLPSEDRAELRPYGDQGKALNHSLVSQM